MSGIVRRSIIVAWILGLAATAVAQDKPAIDESWFGSLKYRLVGPFRGGRSAAVTGVPGKPMLFYFGSTGGGVWRSTDGGNTWGNISDGFFGGSIGAVAVSESDPNVIYVGGGEKTVRGNVSHGTGIWKSTDAGKTWKHIGLDDTRHIPRVRIHPKNPDLVYVAALGHLYGANPQRGVFRSKDGGATWQRVLFVNDEVGAVDLVLDPNNPRILYASTWRVKRTPSALESGGTGSGLWKSTDGGDTWKEITRAKGLPQGTVGIIGVTVSPVNSDRVWAIVEADEGGVFRSDDAGQNWTRVNEDRNLRQRAWYYSRIYAGPKNADEVYVVNVQFWRSGDGGKSFAPIRTPHGDHHDLWIDPTEPARMIVGDDGGAQVSINAGSSWTTYLNQPTAQFYRVTTDSNFPYRILGAQQDNSTVRILSRSDRGVITEHDWEPTAGSESGWIAVSPKDPDVVYGGNYGGYLSRENHKTHESRTINVWPDNPIGHGAADLKYRFQWNFPIFFSPHDPDTLYCAGNVLFKTTNDGQSWQPISPDLTRNDKSKQGPSGGPITKDNTSVEYYCTIFAAAESPLQKGLLWAGSDDGLIHVSRDGGKNWQNVTPPDLPEWSQINSVEPHPTEKGGLYVAATRYKLDDFKPYLYRTLDYGKTWTKIVTGIPIDHFTRVIRASAKRPGLLFAGTEMGMYVSFDDGAHWQKFQLNLPLVPITDLALKNDDLIVATQGRSFWVLDDLSPLYQLKPALAESPAHLFEPHSAYRLPGGFGGVGGPPPRGDGQNPPTGAVIHYRLKEVPAKDAKISLEILDPTGKVVREFSPKAEKPADKLEPKAGMNRLVWDLHYPGAEVFPGMILWGGLPEPRAVPGPYQARLKVGDKAETAAFQVLPDPRSTASTADLDAQFHFLVEARDKLTETHKAIKQIREVREQLTNLQKRVKDDKDVTDAAKALDKSMTAVEEALYQTKAKSQQDVLNYPIRLNNRLSSLAATVADGDNPPTDQAVKLKEELTKSIDAELAKLKRVLGDDLTKFNELLTKKKVPGVFAK
ncbi:MAG: VPS10 domain-containing protein [Gemmataceae bacterium]